MIELEPFKTLDAGLGYLAQDASAFVESSQQRKATCEALLREVEAIDLSLWNESALDEFRERIVKLVSHLVEGVSVDAKLMAAIRDTMNAIQTDLRKFFDSLDSPERNTQC